MELDFRALHEDAAVARAQLAKAHVEHADDPTEALLALYTVLKLEARAVLEAAYDGDEARAAEHERITAIAHAERLTP